MVLSEKEIDLLRWLIKSEIHVQTMLLDESDGTLYIELNNLYEKISGYISKNLSDI